MIRAIIRSQQVNAEMSHHARQRAEMNLTRCNPAMAASHRVAAITLQKASAIAYRQTREALGIFC